MKKTVIFLSLIILLAVAGAVLIFVYQISSQVDFGGNNQKEFVVKKGESLADISQHLLNEGIIKSKLAFKIYLYLHNWQNSIQAGTYVLTPMNSIDLAEILVAGKVDNEIGLTFIEGWTLKDMADYLVVKKIINQPDNFLLAAKINGWREKYDFLQGAPDSSLEGFLFPDTYKVYKDARPDEIINKMLDNFQRKITPALMTEMTARGRSLYDTLIIASIIEQEVPGGEDREIVAGILWKRLDVDMPLQVDSSLKYVIGKKDNPALTFEELEIDSPYNTYKYRGLPPTPIGNPGLSAIRAAIYPKTSDYWFYLSTRDGQTVFSKNLQEHNLNVEKYLK